MIYIYVYVSLRDYKDATLTKYGTYANLTTTYWLTDEYILSPQSQSLDIVPSHHPTQSLRSLCDSLVNPPWYTKNQTDCTCLSVVKFCLLYTGKLIRFCITKYCRWWDRLALARTSTSENTRFTIHIQASVQNLGSKNSNNKKGQVGKTNYSFRKGK